MPAESGVSPSRKPLPTVVREASVADAPDVARLCAELQYKCSDAAMSTRLADAIGDPSRAVLLALIEGRVVGWIEMGVQRALENDPWAEIRGLVVEAHSRRTGVGSRLVRAGIQWARARGVARVRVRTREGRLQAHQFYERVGFVLTKTQRVYDLGL